VRSPEVSNVGVGICANPERDGVLSARPSPRRADRDLNGDNKSEVVVADKSMCVGEGNCYWNLFHLDENASCHRYLGTVAASAIDRLSEQGDGGFSDLRGWWSFSGGRFLLQRYRYRHGGYVVMEAMICRTTEDDRLLCATEEPRRRE